MVNFWRLALPLAVLARGSIARPEALPGSYIVELRDSQLSAEDFLSQLAAKGIHATLRRDLTSSVFSGLSFTVRNNDEDSVDRISSLPGVKWITPVNSIDAPKERVSVADPDSTSWDASAHLHSRQSAQAEVVHQMTGVDKLREEGYTGAGIKVAVVDSGVDYTHPVLGGCFGPGCLVSFGYDLVGDDFTKGPTPDADPFSNCHGHGTHVTGLVAAQANPYGFTGVAPNVTLGHYRVLDCRGRGTTDVFIESFLKAFADGANVITASLGEYSGWSEEPWGVVIQRLVEAGVACLVAVGNDGLYGSFYASNGADGKGATGVGSINPPLAPMFLTKASYSTGNGSNIEFGWTPATGSDAANGSYPLVSLSLDNAVVGDACQALPAGSDLAGKIVLVHRGGCSYAIKAQNVAAAGGTKILFSNNEPGTYEFAVSVAGIEAVGLVPQSTGEEWRNLLGSGASLVVNLVDAKSAGKLYKIEENKLAGGSVAYYTQWGPTNELDLLPTALAPGSFMMSTYPLTMGGYAVESGTSMATPYFAGCIALMLEARGKTAPTTVNSLLSTNSDPKLFHDGKTGYSWLAPVIQQGGGLINVYDAVKAKTSISVSSISFNDTEHYADQSFTISNDGLLPVVFSFGNVGAGTVYTLPADGSAIPSMFDYANYPETITEYATLTFEPPMAVLALGQKVTVKVKATPPPGLNKARIPIYNGYITANGTNGDSLSIPYLGVNGNMKDAVILDTKQGENYLRSSKSADPVPAGFTFNLRGPNGTASGDYINPRFNLRLAMGSKLVRVDVKPSNGTGNNSTTEIGGQRVLGSVPNFPKLFQSRNAVGASIVQWTGQMSDGSWAPAGTYSLLVRALKIFGNPENATEYDIVETPPFSIRYAST